MCNLQLTVTAYDNSDVHSSPGDEILSPWGVHPVLITVNINFINNKHAYFSFDLSSGSNPFPVTVQLYFRF